MINQPEAWFTCAKYRQVNEVDRQSEGSKPQDYEIGCFYDRDGHVIAWVNSIGYLRRPGVAMEHVGPWVHKDVLLADEQVESDEDHSDEE